MKKNNSHFYLSKNNLAFVWYSNRFNLISAIFGKDIEGHNCSSMDVPLGGHVAGNLPQQVVMIPSQDLLGDVVALVAWGVVELTTGDVKIPVEIASPGHP